MATNEDTPAALEEQKRQRYAIVLFCAGLTARAGFEQQRFAALWTEALIYGTAVIAFVVGHFLQSFAVVAYAIVAAGAAAFVLFVPNWRAAWMSAKEGFLTCGEETQFVSAHATQQYYTLLRADEMRAIPGRTPPARF
jgi:hypothetical protein